MVHIYLKLSIHRYTLLRACSMNGTSSKQFTAACCNINNDLHQAAINETEHVSTGKTKVQMTNGWATLPEL
jgi:hypothetical protein